MSESLQSIGAYLNEEIAMGSCQRSKDSSYNSTLLQFGITDTWTLLKPTAQSCTGQRQILTPQHRNYLLAQ